MSQPTEEKKTDEVPSPTKKQERTFVKKEYNDDRRGGEYKKGGYHHHQGGHKEYRDKPHYKPAETTTQTKAQTTVSIFLL